MYKVLYNSVHSPVEIAKWLNDELALGNKIIACNGDFYIFESVEQPLAPDGLPCPVCEQSAGTYTACSYCHSDVTPAGKA